MLRMGLTMGYPIPTYGKIVFPMRTCYVFWVKLDFRHNQFCNDSHAKPISFISVPSKCFPRIGVVWSCPRKEGRLVVWQMKYVTDTTILYIYTYTHIISILILKWCLLAFECIWLVFLLRFEEGSPKMHQTGWPGFMATTLFSLPIHFLICLPSYERWQKRWFSNLISKKSAGIHSLKLGKLPSPLIVWFRD